jgi:hypothetical protein
MGQFLYYLPGSDKPPHECVKAAGLDDRLGGYGHGEVVGPNGVKGWLVGAGKLGGYKPESQTWSGPFGDSGFWIGFYNDDRPTPAELARPRQVRGSDVTMLDGHDWLIPAARFAPSAMIVRDGQVVLTPLELKRRLWARVEQVTPYIFDTDGDGEMEWIDILTITAECLTANYRVSRDPAQELSALGLMSSDNAIEVLQALVDIAAIQRIAEGQKNTESQPVN